MQAGRRLVLVLLIVAACGCASYGADREAPDLSKLMRQPSVPADAGGVQQAAYEAPAKSTVKKPKPKADDDEPGVLTRKVQQLSGKGKDPEEARRLFQQAEARFREATRVRDQALKEGQEGEHAELFEEAAELYAQAGERWPKSALQQDAMFMAGESYFFADNYPDANERYELLLKDYSHTKYLDRTNARRFAIAKYWLEWNEADPESFYQVNVLDSKRPWRDVDGHALRIFDRIRLDDPTGALADDATLAAANAYFAAGKWIKADEFYTDLRKTFPSSEHQFMAHFLGVQAKLNSYQGPEYAGDVLDESEELLKQLRRQFPAMWEQESERLNRTYAKVRYLQAERRWHVAKYYDRRRQYGASRLYYDQITQDFHDTPFAERAETRLIALGDRPDKPAQRLSWLVDLFPDADAAKPLIATSPSTTTRR